MTQIIWDTTNSILRDPGIKHQLKHEVNNQYTVTWCMNWRGSGTKE